MAMRVGAWFGFVMRGTPLLCNAWLVYAMQGRARQGLTGLGYAWFVQAVHGDGCPG